MRTNYTLKRKYFDEWKDEWTYEIFKGKEKIYNLDYLIDCEELSDCCGAVEMTSVQNMYLTLTEALKRRKIKISNRTLLALLIKGSLLACTNSENLYTFAYMNIVYKRGKEKKIVSDITTHLDSLGFLKLGPRVNYNSGNTLISYTIDVHSFIRKPIFEEDNIKIL